MVWSGPLLEESEEAEEARGLVLGLEGSDLVVKGEPVKLSGYQAELPDEVTRALERTAQRDIATEFIHIQHVEPQFYQVTPGAVANIGRASCVTDRVPAEWVGKCNAMDEVWVPSEFAVEAFAFSGVDRARLRKVPPSIDVRQFGEHVKPVKLANPHGFTFLSILDWDLRSGWDVLLRAYVEEFGAAEDVALAVKFVLGSGVTDQDIAAGIRDYLRGEVGVSSPIPQLDVQIDPVVPGLYRACDASVFPCRGEGIGMSCMQAMASGLPVIATGWGGLTEFVTAENAYLVQYSLTDVPASVLAKSPELEGSRWAEPSVEHLRGLMREVFERRDEAREKGRLARDHIERNHDHDKAVEQVKENLARRLGEAGQ